MALLAGGHALLEGVPGLGKTMLVRTLADAVAPDVLAHPVHARPHARRHPRHQRHRRGRGGGKRFQFQRGPIFANVVLADEINRATPKTQSALLEAMQEKSVTVAEDDLQARRAVLRARDAEPARDGGHLSAARGAARSLLRQAAVEFPSRDALHTILDRTTGREEVRAEKVLSSERLLELRELVRQVPVARAVQDFAVRVVEGTHPPTNNNDAAGAAADSEVRALRRVAARRAGDLARRQDPGAPRRALRRLDRRHPHVAKPALRHRLILNFEGEAEGIDPDTIIDSILSETPKP